MRILSGIVGIEFVHFTEVDVVRHPLVAAIIRAYDARDQQRRAPVAASAAAAALSGPTSAEPGDVAKDED